MGIILYKTSPITSVIPGGEIYHLFDFFSSENYIDKNATINILNFTDKKIEQTGQTIIQGWDISKNKYYVNFSLPNNNNLSYDKYYAQLLLSIPKETENENDIINISSNLLPIKITSQPFVEIGDYNLSSNSLQVMYYSGGDEFEYLSKYNIILSEVETDEDDNIISNKVIEDSGWIEYSHNYWPAIITYQPKSIKKISNKYSIVFSTQSINGLQYYRSSELLTQVSNLPLIYDLKPRVNINYDYGYAEVRPPVSTIAGPKWKKDAWDNDLEGQLDDKVVIFNEETNISGNFYLMRRDEEGREALLASLVLSNDENFVYYDDTITQGEKYEYYLKQYNVIEGTKAPIEDSLGTAVIPDFEDIFLSDSDRTLRIRYNPKMSSFKTTILEQKTDTIGGKYPFFFRNGNVAYKELPIGGLISYHADDLMLFDSSLKEEYFPEDKSSRGHTADRGKFASRSAGEEIYLERKYKRAVEEWLTNGKPKLLRTPTEGNFIVRLMNVSLSPMEQLNRSLHSFSATGYEMADYNFENLKKYNLVKEQSSETAEVENLGYVSITEKIGNFTINELPYSLSPAEAIRIKAEDIKRRNITKVEFTSTNPASVICNQAEGKRIDLAENQSKDVPIDSNQDLVFWTITDGAEISATIFYTYYGEGKD